MRVAADHKGLERSTGTRCAIFHLLKILSESSKFNLLIDKGVELMKRILLQLCVSLAAFGFLAAEIFETKHFSEITQHIGSDTLVIFDIDDTLLIPAQTLGCDAWFVTRLNYNKQFIQDFNVAKDKTLAEWQAIRHITDVIIVEEGSDAIIKELQANNIPIIGLTTQELVLCKRTEVQLKSLNIDLSMTAPSKQDHYFVNKNSGVLYRQGIIFTSGSSKGEALVKYFEATNYYPKNIVFVDDKKSHLNDVEKNIAGKNIHFTGLRYGYGDERVANYNQQIADIQWAYSTFNHILSDEEAAEYLQAQGS